MPVSRTIKKGGADGTWDGRKVQPRLPFILIVSHHTTSVGGGSRRPRGRPIALRPRWRGRTQKQRSFCCLENRPRLDVGCTSETHEELPRPRCATTINQAKAATQLSRLHKNQAWACTTVCVLLPGGAWHAPAESRCGVQLLQVMLYLTYSSKAYQ